MPSAGQTQAWLDRQSANSPSAPVSPISSSPYTAHSAQSPPIRDASPVSPMYSLPPQLPPIKRVSSSFDQDWQTPGLSRFDPFAAPRSTHRQENYDFQTRDPDRLALQEPKQPSSPACLQTKTAQISQPESERPTFASSQRPVQSSSLSGDTNQRTQARNTDPRTQARDSREPSLQLASAHSDPVLSSTGRTDLPAPQSPHTALASSVTHAVPYSATTASAQPTLGGKPLKSSDNATFQNGVISHARTSSPRRSDPPPPSKSSGKKGLALLNPVHLLMRRRSAQPSPDSAVAPPSISTTTSLPSLATDYDPRIRGNRVHDFSSPRRQVSASIIPSSVPSSYHVPPSESVFPTPIDQNRASPTLSDHRSYPLAGCDTHALGHKPQQENRSPQSHDIRGHILLPPPSAERERQYPSSQLWHLAGNAHQAAQPPQTGADDQLSQQWHLSDHTDNALNPLAPPLMERSTPQLPRPQHTDHSDSIDKIDETQAGSPNTNDAALPDSQSPRSRTTTTTPDSGLPRRFKSNASRFSFQMAGQDAITEERLLEAKAKDREPSVQKANVDEEDDDFFDEDAMYDQDEFEVQLDQHALPLAAASQSDVPRHDTPEQSIYNLSNGRFDNAYPDPAIPVSSQAHANHDDDDMYYHDGMIDLHAFDAINEERLDENKFDDPNFLARNKDRSISPDPADSYGQDGYDDQPARGSNHLHSSMQTQPTQQQSIDSSDYQNALVNAAQNAAANGRFDRRGSSASSDSSYSEQSSQRQPAAQPLATDTSNEVRPAGHGPMGSDQMLQQRGVGSQDHHPDTYSGFDFGFGERRPNASPAALSTEPLQHRHGEPPVTRGVYDDDDDDYYANDDDIISEANADALASDDEGFYSQEFGFYARARSGSFEEYATNGGYFGEPGIDGIERKWSVREPNLTPITERSEFSTRNSVAGGPRSPGFGPTSNPSFAAAQQLSRHSPMASLAQLQQEELSLDRLLHMRTQSFNSDIAGRRTESMSSIGSVGLAQLRAMTSTPDAGGRAAAPTSLQYGYGMVGEDRSSPTRSHGSSRLAYQDHAEARFESEPRDSTSAPLTTSDVYVTPKRSTLNTAWSPEAPLTAFKTSPVKHNTHRRLDSSDEFDGRAKDRNTLNRVNEAPWT